MKMRDAAVDARQETRVHPTAIVDSDASLGVGVTVGPWALIGPGHRRGMCQSAADTHSR